MARAEPVELSADEPAARAAARVVRVRTGEMLAHSEGVLDTGEIERVHDMRVATRRLRAALEVFRPCFPGKEYKRSLREVKAIADALGERRDCDVSIAALEEFRDGLDGADRGGVEALVAGLRERQAAANRELTSFVAPERLEAARHALDDLAAAAERGGAP